MAPVLPVLAVAGAAISAFGTIEGGIAQGKAASYQAAIAQNNAVIAGQNATHAERAGFAQAAAVSRKAAATQGRIKTAQAANNIDVNSGSAVRVQAGEREAGALDTATTLSNAELQAYGYRNQATGFTAEAGLKQFEAKEAPVGADFTAAGNLLSKASSLPTGWASPA